MAGEFDIMQSDHFGAIGGAKFVDDRIKSELDAQKTLGEIAAQPGKRELDAAHSRLYNAEAAAKEATAQEQRDLQQLLATGQPATGDTEPPSPAQKASRFANILLGDNPTGKVLLGPGLKAAQGAATLLDKEQKVLTGQASQARQEAIAARSRADLVGRWASTITDEASLAQAVMLAQGDAELPPGVREALSQLPPDYASAKPKIDAFVAQGQTVAQAAQQKAKKIDQDLTKARDASTAAKNGSLVKYFDAKTDVAKQTYNARVKNGGIDPDAVALKKAKLKSEQQAQEARDRKLYPLLPPEAVKDPAKRTLGQTYTLPNGSRMTWQGQGWLPAKMPAANPIAPDDDNEPDDDGDDE